MNPFEQPISEAKEQKKVEVFEAKKNVTKKSQNFEDSLERFSNKMVNIINKDYEEFHPEENND